MFAPSTAEIKLAPLSSLASHTVPVFSVVAAELPHVCMYENVHEYNPQFAAHLLHDIYIPRTVNFAPVALATLPPGTVVHGDFQFLTTIGDVFLREQFHADWHPPQVPQVLSSTTPVVEIGGDVLLLARFGAVTWGHWLGELVPRALAAELVAPGKYRFAVPAEFKTRGGFANFLGALAAYGIGEDRLIWLDDKHRYAFSSLATVSSMWVYPYAVHPACLSLLRTALRVKVPKPPLGAKAAAMLRSETYGRHISNQDEILSLLKIYGFSAFGIGQLPFIEQVALFRAADSVFGVLGSNLTGLIYSPFGVKMISVAAADWGDCFFHGLMQAQEGKYADLRGTPAPGSTDMMTAPFTLSIGRLTAALNAVGHLS